MDEAKSVSVCGRMHSGACKRKQRASDVGATVSPVKLEPEARRQDHDPDTDPASLQAELQRKTAELAQTQAERDAALAEIRAHLLHHAKTELQAELWRTTEKIRSATQERDAAVELEAAHRELLTLHSERDSAFADLEAQKVHQREQVRAIEADLQSALSRTRAEIAAVRDQRDALRSEKHSQLALQCDAVFEVEMALKVELRCAERELERARQEHQDVVLEIHLQQEHQREQVQAIEAELQALIQVKAEELKAARRERDRAAQLDLQCEQVTEVEVRLQRNLKSLLGEIHEVEVDQIHDALLTSREKLHDLKKHRCDRSKAQPAKKK